MSARSLARLPCPGVVFEPGFARRLERLVPRLALARERREGTGRSGLAGGGAEFVGFQPYRPGDDLRDLDWNLLARSDRPFVRVTAREAGERWCVLLDASASMGVGPPGKLQRAAEVVAGIAALGIRLHAEVRLLVLPGAEEDGPRERRMRRRADLPPLLRFLEGLRADGKLTSAGLAAAASHRRAIAGCARVFIVGDLLGVRPEDAIALRGRRRELALIRILAPIEIAPSIADTVEWWDPEDEARLRLTPDRTARAAYVAELEAELERWREACARHRVRHACSSSAVEFETILSRALFE